MNAIPNKSDLVLGNQFLLGAVNNTVTANDTMNDAVCARQRAAPVITLPPHQAPIDLKFTADGTEAYISFHGSWSVKLGTPLDNACGLTNVFPGTVKSPWDIKCLKLTSRTESQRLALIARLQS